MIIDPYILENAAPADPDSHLYWRIFGYRMPVTSPPANVQYARIQFLDSADNVLSTGGTPNASNEFGVDFVVENAFDANTATNWSAANGHGEWVSYQFPAAVNVAKVALQHTSAFPAQHWLLAELQYSDDGINWTAKGSQKNLTNPGALGVNTLTFPDPPIGPIPPVGAHRYWRLLNIFGTGSSFYGLQSVDFYGAIGGSGGSDLTSTAGGTGSATNQQGGFPASNAFDNSNATSWFTNAVGYGQAIQWDFGVGNAQFVKSYNFVVSTINGANWVAWAVQYSDDGINWTFADYVTGQNVAEGQSYSANLV